MFGNYQGYSYGSGQVTIKDESGPVNIKKLSIINLAKSISRNYQIIGLVSGQENFK